MSKEKTEEEVREEFLSQIRTYVEYWSNVNEYDTKRKLEGLAFSILNIIDGCTSLPGFILSPIINEEDRQYHIDNGEDYYPDDRMLHLLEGILNRQTVMYDRDSRDKKSL